MRPSYNPITPEEWFRHLFRAKSALDGGVVRRKATDVERMVGREAFRSEIERRGFTAIENAGQIVVFCNSDPVRVLARGKPNFLRKFGRKSSMRI